MDTRCRFVVDQRYLKLGVVLVLKMHDTDEIVDETQKMTLSVQEAKYEKDLNNDIIFCFPTRYQQKFYGCYKLKLTYFYALKIRPKLYDCSDIDTANPIK